MFRRKKSDGGFLLSFLINLVLNFEFAVAAIVLLVLHYTVNVPLWTVWIALGLWIVPTLITTILLFVLVGAAGGVKSQNPNKNPYSKGYVPQNTQPRQTEQSPNKNPYSKS